MRALQGDAASSIYFTEPFNAYSASPSTHIQRALQGDAVCLICCLCLTDYEGFSCQGITGGSSTEKGSQRFLSLIPLFQNLTYP